ncbi:O-methyltransferase [Rhynchospora pubera]|uniref:O-methyltransferase n=1 Tax=Rhynchospora pubera TaxID=906938 RepID=A0AAV8EMR9_9POAL|nr:O-methyltransferase [Rhynchospora pubera]
MESQNILNAQAELWNQTLSFVKSLTLKCAIELGIPNAIHSHGQPMTLSEIHAALSLPTCNKTNLMRLVRMLTHSGFLVVQNTGKNSEEVYDLTPISRLVIDNSDSTSSLSSFVLGILQFTLVKPSFHLGDWLKQDKFEPFEMAFGCTFWELAGKLPEFNTLFNGAMTSDSSFLSQFIVKEHGNVFQGISSLVDVGGGCGSVATAIAKAFPKIECTVLDLPQVVGRLPSNGLVKFVSGDMFSNIPRADAVFLKWILHDWCDEDCIKILQRCKEAIPSKEAGGKVIIVDIVVGSDVGTINHEPQLLFDMLMMTLTKGKEREENEWSNLFKEAGFDSYKITTSLGVRSLIEVYP